MLFLVCYDVASASRAGRKRLAQVARFLERQGTRVQFSVFEVRMTPTNFRYVRAGLLEIINPREDSLRIYPLDEEASMAIEHHGAKKPLELFGVLFFD